MLDDKLIFIFYSLILEEKNKTLKMFGPYIHKKPAEISETPFVFQVKEYKKEKSYLNKLLRERCPTKIPIYTYVLLEKYDIVNIKCICENVYNLHIDNNGIKCQKCGKIITKEDIRMKLRNLAMVEAQDYFERMFEQMQRNYRICSRR